MWSKILGALTGGLLKQLTGDLLRAYELKKTAETQEQVLEAEKEIARLEAHRSILVAEQRRVLTSWIRPALAAPVVIYVWKLLVWDTVLQLGVTENPGDIVHWIVVTIIGAYMLTRPFEGR